MLLAKKKAALAAWVTNELYERGSRPKLLPPKRNRDQGPAFWGQPLVSILRISPFSSTTVVAALARGGEPLKCRLETVPNPGTIRWGTANTFAGFGTSVSCLATS